jgi:hypothetical protein
MSGDEAPLLDTVDLIVLSIAVAAVIAFALTKLLSNPKPKKPKRQSQAVKVRAYSEDDFVGKMKHSGLLIVLASFIGYIDVREI